MINAKSNSMIQKSISIILMLITVISMFVVDVSAVETELTDSAAVTQDDESAAQVDISESSAETTVDKTSATEPTTAKATTFSNKNNVKTTKKFYLRKGKSVKTDAVKLIPKGTTLYLIESNTVAWVKVKDSSGKSGYAPTRYLNKVSGSKVTVKCKTKDDVNLRKGAGTNYAVLKIIPKGKTATVESNSTGLWVKVTYSGKTGYISSDYATILFTIPVDNKNDTTTPSTTNPTTTNPTTAPSTTNPDGTIKFSSSTATAYKGLYYHLKPTNTTGSSITWSTSNSDIATVQGNGIIYGKATGTVTIKAKAGGKTASCKVTVKNPAYKINISNKTYTTTKGKSIYLTSSTGGVTWKSSDTSVLTVSSYGLVNCKKKGTAVIYAKQGSTYASCYVNVKAAEAVKFTYCNPNSAPLNSKVTFIAITDTSRTDVKFVVKKGSTSYTVKASSKTKSGSTYVWKGSKKLTSAGTYSVVAYSMYNKEWSKSTGSYGNAYVTKAESTTEASCEERHASNEVINFISNYEGLLSKAEFDPLTSFPCLTVGYGRVIYAGESFYNGMTKDEAFAYLVESVETDGYVSKVNKYLLNNKVKFNQQHFDSLVTLVYNCGTGIFASDPDLDGVLMNTYPSTEKSPTKAKTSAKCKMYSGAGSSYKEVKTLSKGASLTMVSAGLYSKNWYKVRDSKGAEGYISYKYLVVTSYSKSGTRNLKNTIKQNYLDNFLTYHHAGGACITGLLYRRIDEAEIYFHGDYTRDGQNNKSNFYYRCYRGGFGCG